MAKVILICGKICSGKSTYAAQLRKERKAVVLSVDEIMLAMFGLYAGERHDEYAQRTQAYLLNKSVELIESGIDVILDWGFWTKEGRARVRAFYAGQGINYAFHYLEVDEEAWQARLNKRNAAVAAGQALAYPVDRNLATKFEKRFEMPTKEEMDVWISW